MWCWHWGSVWSNLQDQTCLCCAALFCLCPQRTVVDVNEVLTLSYHLSSLLLVFFSIISGLSFFSFTLTHPPYSILLKISFYFPLNPNKIPNFPPLLFTSLSTTGMLHFLKVRSHSWVLQKFASFRFWVSWVCLFHPSIVVSLFLIAELNQVFIFFIWVCVILLGKEDLFWY